MVSWWVGVGLEGKGDGREGDREGEGKGGKGTVSRNDESKVHEPPHDDFIVLEHVHHIPKCNLPVRRTASLIDPQPRLYILPLLLGQPFRIFREIGDEEVKGECYDAGEDAFEDEDPSPGGVAAHAVHFPDGGGEETAEGAGEGGAAEEEGVAFLGFGAFVPHSDEVEGWERD